MDFVPSDYAVLRENYIKTNSEENLIAVCAYLDATGMHMPHARYQYDDCDRSTWMFFDGRVKKNDLKDTVKYFNVYNPNFRYKVML